MSLYTDSGIHACMLTTIAPCWQFVTLGYLLSSCWFLHWYSEKQAPAIYNRTVTIALKMAACIT